MLIFEQALNPSAMNQMSKHSQIEPLSHLKHEVQVVNTQTNVSMMSLSRKSFNRKQPFNFEYQENHHPSILSSTMYRVHALTTSEMYYFEQTPSASNTSIISVNSFIASTPIASNPLWTHAMTTYHLQTHELGKFFLEQNDMKTALFISIFFTSVFAILFLVIFLLYDKSEFSSKISFFFGFDTKENSKNCFCCVSRARIPNF